MNRGQGTGVGWLVFAVTGALNVVQGAVLILFGGEAVQDSIQGVTGVPWSLLLVATPSLAAYVNDVLMILGLFVAAFGAMVLAVSVTGYRRGEPWAWYLMWAAPVFYLLTSVILLVKGEIYFSDDLSIELFSALLLLSFVVQVFDRGSFRRGGSLGQ